MLASNAAAKVSLLSLSASLTPISLRAVELLTEIPRNWPFFMDDINHVTPPENEACNKLTRIC